MGTTVTGAGNFFLTYSLPVWLLTIATVVALGLAVYWMHQRVRSLEERYRALVADTAGGDLGDVLQQHLENVRQSMAYAAEARAAVDRFAQEAQTHLQHCGVVRFNPFANTGGDQSFCIALADAQGQGVVITSLHARDGTRIYAKPLTDWRSPYALTEEEQAAIRQARERPSS